MMGPAWRDFPALEAEARRLFRSARLWHQPGFLDADGVEQTEITSVAEVPVVTRDTDPNRLIGLNVHGGTSLEHFKMLVAAAV